LVVVVGSIREVDCENLYYFACEIEREKPGFREKVSKTHNIRIKQKDLKRCNNYFYP